MTGPPNWDCQQHLRALEAARSGLLGDLSAIRQAILKGAQLSRGDRERLAEHLRETDALLTAAKQACQEILSSIAETPK